MHVNDSKTPFDSHRDRHENIGRGSIPMEAFHWIMNNPKFQVWLLVYAGEISRENQRWTVLGAGCSICKSFATDHSKVELVWLPDTL